MHPLDVPLYESRTQDAAAGWIDANPQDVVCVTMSLIGLEIFSGQKRGIGGLRGVGLAC